MLETNVDLKFAAKVAEALQEIAPEFEYEAIDFNKNGVSTPSIMARKDRVGMRLSVTCEDLDPMEHAKKMLPTICAALADAKADEVDDIVKDFMSVKDKLVFKLLPRRALSEDIVARPVADLVEVVVMLIEFNGSRGAMTVTKALAELWGVTKQTLFAYADLNSRMRGITTMDMSFMFACTPLSSGLAFMATYQAEDGGLGEYGADIVNDPRFVAQMAEKFPGGYYILPSSVHEIICIDKNISDKSAKDLQEMMYSINREIVAPADWLSDNIYEIVDGKLAVVDVDAVSKNA
ncbi:MAG: DUF5688 family protein [Butyrivibrio sp.]|nr:DUF5688 family protein [Butyrivibrio sp.]